MKKAIVCLVFVGAAVLLAGLHSGRVYADNTYPPGFGTSTADDAAESRLDQACPTYLAQGMHTLGILYPDPAVSTSGSSLTFTLKSGARVCDDVNRYNVHIKITALSPLSKADSINCNTTASVTGISMPYDFDPQGQTIRGTQKRYYSDIKEKTGLTVTGLKPGCNGFKYTYCMYSKVSPGGKDNFSCIGVGYFYIDSKVPVLDCSIASIFVTAGQSAKVTAKLNHRGSSGTPTVDIGGSLRVSSGATVLHSDTVSTQQLVPGSSINVEGVSHVYDSAGTYNIAANFSAKWSEGSVQVECGGTITVTLPRPKIECSVDNATILLGASYAARITVKHTGPSYAPSVTYTANVQVLSQSVENLTGTIANGQTVQLPTTARTFASPGQYNVTANISGGTSLDTASCSAVITVLTGPYMQAFAADIQTGGGFSNLDESCVSGEGAVKAFIRSSDANFAGSGAQLAVFARGAIQGFRSASMRTGSFPFSLTFANGTAITTSSIFGGQFGGSACMQNYWSSRGMNAELIQQTIDIGSLSDVSRSYYVKQSDPDTPVTLTGTIANGHYIVMYIEGDVFIQPNASGHFGYESSSWGNTVNIPSLYVVAKGNIYISSSSKTLDGQYVAVPASDNDGRITTCTDPNTHRPFVQQSDLITQCNKQLIVHGTFSAKQINFLRTYGNVQDAVAGETFASSKAAEVFQYNLETILSIQPTAGIRKHTYDSITALPPSL